MRPLAPFGPSIWIAEGAPVVAALGFHYPTRMTVIRLSGGALVILSPIPLTADLKQAVDALGPVGHIVAPNSLHHLWVGDWQTAYPAARTYAAPGLPAKRPDLHFDMTLTDDAPADWSGDIEHVLFHGNAITTEAVFFHPASGTAIFTDLLQQLPRGWFKGWRALVARLDLMVEPAPSVPRKFRMAFTNRAAARTAWTRVSGWPVRALIMAHGTPVTTSAADALSRAFRWLEK